MPGTISVMIMQIGLVPVYGKLLNSSLLYNTFGLSVKSSAALGSFDIGLAEIEVYGTSTQP